MQATVFCHLNSLGYNFKNKTEVPFRPAKLLFHITFFISAVLLFMFAPEKELFPIERSKT